MLDAVADAPRHGYEIMQVIEERSKGAYRPSPGVIYPTLQLLDETGLPRGSEGEPVARRAQWLAVGECMRFKGREATHPLRPGPAALDPKPPKRRGSLRGRPPCPARPHHRRSRAARTSSRGYVPGPYSNREELLHALDRFVLERTS